MERPLLDAQRCVSFTGAGLSAPSGVQTFRDPDDGWWSKFDPMFLASPEGFAKNPELVMRWYAMRRQQIANAKPNAAHHALASRVDMVHVTQNTDNLLERAGATDVLHVHGHINRDQCHGSCGWSAPIDCAAPETLRLCPNCQSHFARPGVVWFGEALPQDVWAAAVEAVETCDALLVVGTSALVQPAAGLISLARRAGAHVTVVNLDASIADAHAHDVHVGSAEVIVPGLLEQ
jgi:NAD-dependent deacetylase